MEKVFLNISIIHSSFPGYNNETFVKIQRVFADIDTEIVSESWERKTNHHIDMTPSEI